MNYKVLLSLVTVLLVSCLVLTGCQTTTSTSTQTFQFKFATSEVETNEYSQQFIIPYLKKIQELSKGRIKVDPYFSDSLCPQSELISSLSSGGPVDMAWISPAGYGRVCALAGFTSAVPGVSIRTKDKNGKYVVDVIGEKYLSPNELKGVKVNIYSEYCPDNLLLGKKQVKTLEDAKGLIIAYMGGSIAPIGLKSLGMTPEFIAPLDLYTALQRGTVDGITSGPNVMESFSLFPVLKHVTMNVELMSTIFFHAMNWDSWNKLPSDLQKVMDEANTYGKELLYDVTLAKDENALKKFKDAGGTVYYLTDAERARWIEATKGVGDTWAAQMDGKGLPGTQLVKELRQIMSEARPAK